MKKALLLLFLCTLFLPLASQDLDSIEGLWTGDRGLGNVFLYADGTGYVTFSHLGDLKMSVSISRQGNKFIIEQNEENRWEFLTYALKEEIAKQAAEVIRPMRWEMTLSSDGKSLEGDKLTTSLSWDDNTLELTDYDNSYVRDALWKRLEGEVSSDFEPRTAEDNKIFIEVISVHRNGETLTVQFNATNLDYEDREHQIFTNGGRIIDDKGRTWEELDYVIVGADRGNTWSGTTLVQDIPVFNEIMFIGIPDDMEEIKLLEFSGTLFKVRFRDMIFTEEE